MTVDPTLKRQAAKTVREQFELDLQLEHAAIERLKAGIATCRTERDEASRDMLEQFLNDHPSLGCILLLGVAEGLARRTRGMVKKLNATWELSY